MSIHVQPLFQGFIQDQKNFCLGGHLLVAASKHDENCPITVLFYQISHAIFFYAVTARKYQ